MNKEEKKRNTKRSRNLRNRGRKKNAKGKRVQYTLAKHQERRL